MKARHTIDDRYRSLLQKAVRRGDTELVFSVCTFMESQGVPSAAWIESRTAVIALAECWPLGLKIIFTKGFHSKVAALAAVAAYPKVRDATGLGFLAYALSKGDSTVLDGSDADRTLRLLAKGLHHPPEFWHWITSQPAGDGVKNLWAHARRYPESGRPHDRAVSQAAAYLALTAAPPALQPAAPAKQAFPFWVVFDRHTAEGQRVLRDVSRDLHIPAAQLEWVLYYFEGSMPNAELPSEWWRRYCRWHFQRLGISPEEAELIWRPAKSQITDALAHESRKLQAELYRWKLGNLERIEALRRQVAIFNEHLAEVRRDQSSLF